MDSSFQKQIESASLNLHASWVKIHKSAHKQHEKAQKRRDTFVQAKVLENLPAFVFGKRSMKSTKKWILLMWCQLFSLVCVVDCSLSW